MTEEFRGVPEMRRYIREHPELTDLQKKNLRELAIRHEPFRKAIIHKLPRKIKGVRCVALSPEGAQCKNTAVLQTTYHGDSEMYFGGPEPSWVLVAFCADHTDDKCRRVK
jgi:hypothetical protein